MHKFWLLLALAGCGPVAPTVVPLKNTVAEDVTGAKYAQAFDLTDHNGRHRALSDFHGKVVAVFFGYTHCPDVCPTTLYDFAQAMTLLGKNANKVQVLFITLDPARDTQDKLAQFVPAFNPNFLGLYTDVEHTSTLAKEFNVYYRQQPVDASGNYAMDHSAFAYIYDADGRLRLRMPYGEVPSDIASDIRQLIR
ncbi:SCO family protein [Sulfuriferula nivalis]|uniref:Lipoprotein n=1 Tax=Sulfuriferula nivalis TaxID=2675298 RepID=A0A809RN22_9PROT|nr:SCO family protein [Sulfuriferula nivalis]BBP02174.1 lipoprotein [Sulfuriferula nivalis]